MNAAAPVSTPVIAIDGPAASGKGTLSRLLALELGCGLLDSGAIYRSLGLLGADKGLAADDVAAHLRLKPLLDPVFRVSVGAVRVELGGVDRTAEIRSERTGARAASLAQHMDIRNMLLDLQRSYRRAPGLVADGRDMATRVFTDAALAIYVFAAPEERARRRAKELQERGDSVSICALTEDIKKRDQADEQRHASPLRKAANARTLDTTDLDIDSMKAVVLDWVRSVPDLRALADQPSKTEN